MEGSRKCTNAACGAVLAIGEWKKGWGLRSGGFAELCNSCGGAYERLDFCDIFHSNETGWRECCSCGKRLHCGCTVSKSFMELLDSGGVQCISCVEHSTISTEYLRLLNSRSPIEEKASCLPLSAEANTFHIQATAADGNVCDDFKIMTMNRGTDVNGQSSSNGSVSNVKPELVMLSVGNRGPPSFSNINQIPQGPSGDRKKYLADTMLSQTQSQTHLLMSLGTPNQHHSGGAFYNSANSQITVPVSNTVAEGKESNKMPASQQQTQRTRHLLPKPPRPNHSSGPEITSDMFSSLRVVRPPVEGRGRTQLLPRYWPRITDEELQQMTGDPNSTIVPLFEKVLSASDAGRIGRLVLPKACAEAYFPSISQPEGLPLKIQDVKGKNWVFQFRFWPNNNSRMYVLEGVTPCIQSLQLQAGDTVTFSRMEPEGKLIMGFRKATNAVPLQDSQISAIANGSISNETILSGVSESMSIISCYPGPHQSQKENPDTHLTDSPELVQNTNKHGGNSTEELQKRCGYGGSKSKRLHIDYEDALELKLTWEEAQDLLRPPLSSKPSIVVIEDHEFEEYEEPPVLGKRTIFTAQTSGICDQWAQCDNCFKWRRLPTDVLLPSKWTCSENKWDLKRSSCSAPTEISPTDLQNLVQQNADLKRQKVSETQKSPQPPQQEASGLDALATVAALGDDTSPITPVAKTTKHPRHRPGCTCIVCIQPPSGKGPKHKPDCSCNVCITVRRRFNTLMMRKKKRQTEQEEAAPHKSLAWVNNDEVVETNDLPKVPTSLAARIERSSGFDRTTTEELVKNSEHLNLNFRPMHETHLSTSSRANMSSHPRESDHASQTFQKTDGSASLSEQAVLRSCASPQLPENMTGITTEQSCSAMRRDQGSSPEEGGSPSDKS